MEIAIVSRDSNLCIYISLCFYFNCIMMKKYQGGWRVNSELRHPGITGRRPRTRDRRGHCRRVQFVVLTRTPWNLPCFPGCCRRRRHHRRRETGSSMTSDTAFVGQVSFVWDSNRRQRFPLRSKIGLPHLHFFFERAAAH